MSKELTDMHENPARFWENRYRAASPGSSGIPGVALRRFAEPLTPGRALDLGCAKGDDAVWLARKGWSVTAVEISQTALDYTTANAARAGVADHIVCERHDLTRSFPESTFDLVAASFLAAFPREPVFLRAAQAVTPGGHLLIIDHGSRAPWSWADSDTQYPTAEETLATISLDERDWTRVHVDALEREARGPSGETALVRDNIIFLRRN